MMIRAPDSPCGCPIAKPPPQTLTLSKGAFWPSPSSLMQARAWLAKASFNSQTSMSFVVNAREVKELGNGIDWTDSHDGGVAP